MITQVQLGLQDSKNKESRIFSIAENIPAGRTAEIWGHTPQKKKTHDFPAISQEEGAKTSL